MTIRTGTHCAIYQLSDIQGAHLRQIDPDSETEKKFLICQLPQTRK